MFPSKYKTQAPAIASYSTSDLAQNTGIQDFYCAKIDGPTHILTQSQIYSSYIETSVNNTTITEATSPLLAIDQDYDLTQFNVPQTIRGKALITGTFYFSNSGTGVSCSAYLTFIIRKWNSETSTETDIVSGTTESLTYSNNVAGKRLYSLAIDIPTTNFKKGETLRVSLQGYLSRSSGGPSGQLILYVAHDPMNRDGNSITPSTDFLSSQIKVWIPYDLHLK